MVSETTNMDLKAFQKVTEKPYYSLAFLSIKYILVVLMNNYKIVKNKILDIKIIFKNIKNNYILSF